MDDFLLLIDGSSLLTTQFFGNLPTDILFAKTDEEKAKHFHKIMHTSTGVYTNAVYGFMRTLSKILKEQRPSHMAVAWDMTRDTFRREIYPDYKANRGETLAPLKDQFVLCQQVLKRIGVMQFMDPHFEADDFCGSIARKFEKQLPVKILTKDQDYLQLVDERVNLWMMHSTAKKTEELYKKYKLKNDGSVPERCINLTPELIVSEYGVKPTSIADLKGLQGDSSDNIKGVPGVGPATAVALVAKYETVEALYDAMEGLDDKELKSLAASWKEIGVSRSPINQLLKTSESELVGREAAFLSKKLATIKCDIDLGDISLDNLVVSINQVEAENCFDELEFRSLKADFASEEEAPVVHNVSITNDFCELEAIKKRLLETKRAAISLLCEKSWLYGIAITFSPEETVYVAAEGFITEAAILDLIMSADKAGVILSTFNLKAELKCFDKVRFSHIFDNMLVAYILDPISGAYLPSDIASKYGHVKLQTYKSLLGRLSLNEAMMTISDSIIRACAEESRAAYIVYEPLKAGLESTQMIDIYNNIEMPLVYVLDAMEKDGVLVDRASLKAFSNELDSGIRKLEGQIWEAAGEQFNINSPKQLGVILFEKLAIPYGKKGKSGYSTSAEVLEKLANDWPIVKNILEYRQLSKLKSTYADGLDEYIDADGRIRTTFNQTVTATGRLSSTEPNLQNIPIRTELGRLIRKCFIPKEGYIFIDSDYSQIELRILAAMSGDEKLINAYKNSEDIHRATAAAVFKLPYEEVTPEIRSKAKAVNFGIVYGISSFGLGNGLNISRTEAENYIAAYFDTYPAIKAFLDGLVNSAKELGYAKTMFGRRRGIPELRSENYMQRQFGERVAMNSPVQGTAADIIKIAMLKVYDRLEREAPEARLILQIHDELLVEAPIDMADKIKLILEEEMKNAVALSVPMEVGTEMGYDWSQAH